MITANDSARVFELVKAPAPGTGQRLADKLQRLCLEQPRVVAQLEHLVDVFLAPDGVAR